MSKCHNLEGTFDVLASHHLSSIEFRGKRLQYMRLQCMGQSPRRGYCHSDIRCGGYASSQQSCHRKAPRLYVVRRVAAICHSDIRCGGPASSQQSHHQKAPRLYVVRRKAASHYARMHGHAAYRLSHSSIRYNFPVHGQLASNYQNPPMSGSRPSHGRNTLRRFLVPPRPAEVEAGRLDAPVTVERRRPRCNLFRRRQQCCILVM